MQYRRHACTRCNTVTQRYASGKRIRCTKCQRLIGRNCCATIIAYVPTAHGPFGIRGDTCIDCVPSAPEPSPEV